MNHLNEEKLSAFMEGDLPAEESRAAESHLKDCVQCAQALERLREMVTSLAQLPDLVPPADLRVRINERLSRDEPWASRAWRWFTLEWLPIPARVVGTMAVAVLVVGIGLWFTPDYWRRVLEDEKPEEQLARRPSAVTEMAQSGEEEQLEPADEAYVHDRGGVGLAKEGRGKIGKREGTRRIPSVGAKPEGTLSEEVDARWSTLEGRGEKYDSSVSAFHDLDDEVPADEEVAEFGRDSDEAMLSPAAEAAPGIEAGGAALKGTSGPADGDREYGIDANGAVDLVGVNGRLLSGTVAGLDGDGLRFRGDLSAPLADVSGSEGQAAADRVLRTRVLSGEAEAEGEPDSRIRALAYLSTSPETATSRASEAMETAKAELKEMEAGEATISLQKQAEEKSAASFMEDRAKASVIADEPALLKDQDAKVVELAEMTKAIRDVRFEEAEQRGEDELQLGMSSKTRQEVTAANETLDRIRERVSEPGGEELLAKQMIQPGRPEAIELPGAEELGGDIVLSLDAEQPVSGDVMDDSLQHYAFAGKGEPTLAHDYALYPGGKTGWGGVVVRQGYDLVLQAGDPAALEEKIDEVVLANGWTVVEEDLADEQAMLFFSEQRPVLEVSDRLGDAVERDSADLEEELADEGREGLGGNGLLDARSASRHGGLREAKRYESAVPAPAQVTSVTRVVHVQVPVEERANALYQIANLVQPDGEDYVKYWYYRDSDRAGAGGFKPPIYLSTGLEPPDRPIMLKAKGSPAEPAKGGAAAIAAASRPAESTPEVFFEVSDLCDVGLLDVPAGHAGRYAAFRERRLEAPADGEEWFREAGESGLVTLSILLEPLEKAPPHPAAEEPTQIFLERHK